MSARSTETGEFETPLDGRRTGGLGGAAWAILAVAVLTPVRDTSAQQPTLAIVGLSDSLYVIHGHPGGNVIVRAGAGGTLLVDAQSATVEDTLHRVLQGLTDRPVGLIINTHYHEDHIGGNGSFRAAGTEVMGHARLRLRAVVDTTIDELEWHREPADREDLPTVEIARDTTIHWDGAAVDIFTFEDAHTDGDLAVFFREANVLHTGDVVEVDAYPFVDWWGGGSLDGTIAAVDRLLSVADDRTAIVPGHGHVVDRSHLMEYRAMLATVRDRVLAAIARGDELSAVMDSGLSAEWDADRGGAQSGRRFVGVLFLGLTSIPGGSR